MKNILGYYYDLHPNNIIKEDDNYFFDYENSRYVFQVFDRPISDAKYLYDLNKKMISNGLLVHEIILNKENDIITFMTNIPYVLMEVFIDVKGRIDLKDVCYINNNTIGLECNNVLNRYNWISLWESKVDYIENQINEVGKKYPNLCTYVNYYIGLSENAIVYAREVNKLEDLCLYSVCHKRIRDKSNLFELYNPLSYVYDYRVRDASEYIKSSFFNEENAYKLIQDYFQNNYISYKEALMFYARLLYPSYFFDIFEDIINNNLTEDMVNKLILKSQEYEIFLSDTQKYLSLVYNRYVPIIDWLKKRSY